VAVLGQADGHIEAEALDVVGQAGDEDRGVVPGGGGLDGLGLGGVGNDVGGRGLGGGRDLGGGLGGQHGSLLGLVGVLLLLADLFSGLPPFGGGRFILHLLGTACGLSNRLPLQSFGLLLRLGGDRRVWLLVLLLVVLVVAFFLLASHSVLLIYVLKTVDVVTLLLPINNT